METPPPQPEYVQYPRGHQYPGQPGGSGPIPPAPPAIRFDTLVESWNIIGRDLGNWAVAGLLLVIVTSVAYTPFSILSQWQMEGLLQGNGQVDSAFWTALISSQLFLLPGLVLQTAVTYCFAHMCLYRIRTGQLDYGQFFQGFRYFLPLMGVALIGGLIKLVAWGFLLVPGMYLTGALAFAPYLVFDRKMSVFEALGKSLDMLRGGTAFFMFSLILVSIIFSGLGALACCIGVIVTIPIQYLVLALHYHAYISAEDAAAGVPAG